MSPTTSTVRRPSRFVVVRHGATVWSADGRHTGRTDVELTAAGRAQAAALPGVLARLLDPVDALVFTSPLRRATSTAQLALAGHRARVTGLLAEVDYGDYEGMTTAQIRQRRPGWDLFRDGTPRGERIEDAGARADAFVELATAEAADRPVIAVTHGHLGRILTARLLGLDATAGAVLYNETASVGVVLLRREVYVLDGWNLRAAP